MAGVDVTQRLDINQARKLISSILSKGKVVWYDHVKKELVKDDLTEVDAVNVLRGGKLTEQPEFVRSWWRYRVHTAKICVVVQFESATELSVVTAWRKKP